MSHNTFSHFPISHASEHLSSRSDAAQAVLREAERLLELRPDWVRFYRDILGLDGVARRHFTTAEQMAAFEQTEEYQQVQKMLAFLREQPVSEAIEQTKVITVRLPKSLHEALRDEAYHRRTSMNKLCISKLLQYVNDELVPDER